MTAESELIQQLVAAQRAGTHVVDPAPYAALDRAAAYRVQTGVMSALGERAALYKVGVAAGGAGIVAPIYASRVGVTNAYGLPLASVTGLEVEVGVVLGRDLPPAGASIDTTTVAAAVDHYFLGVEICGTRYTDRLAAGPEGGLADNVSAYGYCINPVARSNKDEIDGIEVQLEFAGARIYAAPARHSFGTVLASLVAYANSQHPSYPLRAGTIVTTGSLCGLVPTSGTGHVKAVFGGLSVEFDII
jgi:2-keto-4-pentenoate hydratase